MAMSDAERALSALKAIDAHLPHDRWLGISIAAKDAGVAFDDWLEWCRSGGDSFAGVADCKARWKSFKRTSGDPAALFRAALDAGWEDPAHKRERDPAGSASRPGKPSRPAGSRSATKARHAPDDDDAGEQEKIARRREGVRELVKQAQAATSDFPYLARKQLSASGLHLATRSLIGECLGYSMFPSRKGPLEGGILLVVPLRDAEGRVHNVELIDGDGRKHMVSGLERAGLAWHSAALTGAERRIGFAEGMATAKTVADASPVGFPVLAVGGYHNFEAVIADALRRCPGAEPVLFGDLGAGGLKVQELAERSYGLCLLPDAALLAETGGTDFNDQLQVLDEASLDAYLRYRLVTPGQVLLSDAARSRLVIDEVLPGLPVATVGLLVGQGAIGKSMLTLQAAISVALGRDLVTDAVAGPSPLRPLKAGDVAVLLGEDDKEQIHNRLHDLAKHMGLTPDDLAVASEHTYYRSLAGHDMRLVQKEGAHGSMLDGPFNVMLNRVCHGRRLVIIDPLLRLHDSEESDNTAASHLMLKLTSAAARHRCAIIVLHHVTKSSAQDGQLTWGAARGAGAYTTSARWQLMIAPPSEEQVRDFNLERMPDRYVRMRLVKHNYCPAMPLIWLERGEGGGLTGLPEAPPVQPIPSSFAAPPLTAETPQRTPPRSQSRARHWDAGIDD